MVQYSIQMIIPGHLGALSMGLFRKNASASMNNPMDSIVQFIKDAGYECKEYDGMAAVFDDGSGASVYVSRFDGGVMVHAFVADLNTITGSGSVKAWMETAWRLQGVPRHPFDVESDGAVTLTHTVYGDVWDDNDELYYLGRLVLDTFADRADILAAIEGPENQD